MTLLKAIHEWLGNGNRSVCIEPGFGNDLRFTLRSGDRAQYLRVPEEEIVDENTAATTHTFLYAAHELDERGKATASPPPIAYKRGLGET